MAFIPKSRTEIKQIITNLLDIVGLTALSSGVSENIIEGAVDILYSSELKKQSLDNQTNPTLTSGIQLDAIAKAVGLSRQIGDAIVDLTYSNFHFYIGGNLRARDITIDGGGFVIPAGTSVSDAYGNEYVTLADCVFRADSSIVYVPIAATGPVSQDVPPNSILSHSFDILSTQVADVGSLKGAQLFCNNSRTISGSYTDEPDENLRFRIGLFGNSLNQSNEERLTGLLETIPGVSGITLEKNKRGIGSIEVSLITATTTPSDSIYAKAEAIIRKSIFGADAIYVIKPQMVPVRMTINLVFDGDVVENMQAIYDQIAISTSDYINIKIQQGGTLDPSVIINNVLDSVNGLTSAAVGCLYINNRRVVPGIQKLRKDQKFIVLNPADITIG